MEKRKNYYILLELKYDPPENNLNIIEKRIKQKKNYWIKQSNLAKGMEYKQLLELIPDIKRVMLDRNLRLEEAAKARQDHDKETAENSKALDDSIDLMALKGIITEQEILQLIENYKKYFTENEIRKRINKLEIKIVKDYDNKQTSNKAALQMERATLIDIEDNLRILEKTDLYDFLNVSPSLALTEIDRHINQKDQTLKRNTNITNEKTASQRLIGYCRDIFKTKEKKEMYDASLKVFKLEYVIKRSLQDAGGVTKKIHEEQYQHILKKAKEKGFEEDFVQAYIVDFCQKKKWDLSKPVKQNENHPPEPQNTTKVNKTAGSSTDGSTKGSRETKKKKRVGIPKIFLGIVMITISLFILIKVIGIEVIETETDPLKDQMSSEIGDPGQKKTVQMKSIDLIALDGSKKTILYSNEIGMALRFEYDNWYKDHTLKVLWYRPDGQQSSKYFDIEIKKEEAEKNEHTLRKEVPFLFKDDPAFKKELFDHTGKWKVAVLLDGKHQKYLLFETIRSE